jgi:hypothetical protein
MLKTSKHNKIEIGIKFKGSVLKQKAEEITLKQNVEFTLSDGWHG